MSTNSERLAKYRAKMDEVGFKRLSFYVSAELDAFLKKERKPSECGGRTLERLLLGEAAKRPHYWTAEERARRSAKASAFRQKMEQGSQ